jgi:hypothetical protein
VHRKFPGTQIILKQQGNPQFPKHTALFATIAQPCFKLLSPSPFINLKQYPKKDVLLVLCRVALLQYSTASTVRGGTTVLNLNLLSDNRNVSLRSPI